MPSPSSSLLSPANSIPATSIKGFKLVAKKLMQTSEERLKKYYAALASSSYRVQVQQGRAAPPLHELLLRLLMSKINKPLMSLARFARQMKKAGRENKIVVMVDTVNADDKRVFTPRLTEKASERILKNLLVVSTIPDD